MKKQTVLLICILILASALRLWQIGNVPISPDWDEAALGYNAFSILQTGRDEYGKVLPLTLRSFDDYKPALYAYFIIPFIKLFGLSVIAVRLPSALFGIAAVLGTYLLVLELVRNPVKVNALQIKKEYVGLLAALLLAVSPWHIQFSRVAFEANVGLTLTVFSVLFFLKGLKKPTLLSVSAVLMGLNLYMYQSQKVFTPLLLLVLLFLFAKQIFSMPKKFIGIAVIFGFLIALPFLISLISDPGSLARARGVSFLSDKTPLLQENSKRIMEDRERGDLLGLVVDNRRFVYVKTFIAGYLSHFNFNWLFLKGDFENNRHHAPDMGLVYLTFLPFLILGVYKVIFSEREDGISREAKVLLFLWLLLAPLPAAITKDVPHAVRTLQMVPVLQILTAWGMLAAYGLAKRIHFRPIRGSLYVVFLLVFLLNFFYYLNQYFVQMNYFYAKDWQYGYKELIGYIKPIKDDYNKIIVSNRGTMDQSYIFFLFYFQYDPKQYLATGGTRSGGLSEVGNRFSNFEFRPFDYYKENDPSTLLIGSPADFPEVGNEIHAIYYPDMDVDTEPAIRVVEK